VFTPGNLLGVSASSGKLAHPYLGGSLGGVLPAGGGWAGYTGECRGWGAGVEGAAGVFTYIEIYRLNSM